MARCAAHRGPTRGFCALCFRIEVELHVIREHPDLKADDVVRVVDECLLAADERVH